MSTRRNHILATGDQHKRLAHAFDLSLMSAYRALSFETNSYESRAMRVFAVNVLGCPVWINRNHLLNT